MSATRREREDRARLVLDFLASFAKLESKATDETGWIALKFSATRSQAGQMIADARKDGAK